jgi:ssDNA-binding Zn-finger/Zn-ribbon topoisomerase 1
MRVRKAKSGQHAGAAFWGCSGDPECKGTRPVETGENGAGRMTHEVAAGRMP